MKYIKLNNGFPLPCLGLGTYTIHDANVFSRALEYGYELFDTAWKYENERLIGDVLAHSSQSYWLISKVHGSQYNGRKRYLYMNKQSVASCWRQSSKRMLKNGPSILLLHSLFHNYIDAYRELIQLYESGLVSGIGVCNCNTIEQLQFIHDNCGRFPMINQIEIHPFCTQKRLVSFCQEHDIIVMARSPFAHGLILKQLKEKLDGLCRYYNKSVPQIILNWIVQNELIAIPRSANIYHLKENIEIFDFNLQPSELQSIDMLDRNMSFGCVI